MASKKAKSSNQESKLKKPTSSKPVAGKPSTVPAGKKAPAKSAAPKKSASKTSSAKTSSAKTPAKKAPAKKSSVKVSSGKKPSSKNKYGPSVGARVGQEIDAMEHGELYSGSGQKVTSRKQAIAIALSEKRREGAKVPPNPNDPKPKSAPQKQQVT